MSITRFDFNEKSVTLLASNVLAGTISKHWNDNRDREYLIFHQNTGGAAPNEAAFLNLARTMFAVDPNQEIINDNVAIDVYCYANKEDGKAEQCTLLVDT